ncbi:hypothetical protein U9M48_017774 [Paspalum notatum var. saurae]|uniref:ENTH domain-containing protein n=1 Tax=Paspalum notatum var. saurae TaxID=547442 RepID=A0AAQ3T996_PASNO
MDFMKVVNQTVREIKREVNLKVLKVPEIEQKVLDATSDEPWGPHGSDLADIARATKRLGESAMITSVLWQRLGDTGANWRHVYKALAVIEYLLANGTERVVDEIIDNSSQIAKLTSFEYVEPNGKDVGLSVRKKAENVLAIVDDREKLQQVREKAAATRDKYFGLSSAGVTYNSSATSFGSGRYSSANRYGSTPSPKEADTSSDIYRSKEYNNKNKETISNFRSTRQTPRENLSSAINCKPTKEEGHRRRNQDSATSHLKSSSNLRSTCGGPSSQKVNYDDNDDFNPRGSSTSGTANVSSDHVKLFGSSLTDDLVHTTASTSRAPPHVGTASVPEVDLFANADFQSANAPLESATGSHTQTQMSSQESIDLFTDRSPFACFANSDTEFSVRGSLNKSSELTLPSFTHSFASAFDPFQPSFATSFPLDTEFSVHDNLRKSKNPAQHHSVDAVFDPFTAIPVRNFGGSNSLGTFSSNTGMELPKANAVKPLNKPPAEPEAASMPASKPAKKVDL